MEEKKPIKVFPRRLARKMAKAQLDRRGATGYNKNRAGGSTFSRTWRQFAVEASQYKNTKGAKRK